MQMQSWFDAPKDEVFRHVFELNNSIETDNRYRYENYLLFLRAYMGRSISGLDAYGHSQYDQAFHNEPWPVMNIVASNINTLTANITANKPKVTFLTDGATASKKEKAKKMNRVYNGILKKKDYYRIAPKCFKDGLLFQTGFLKVVRKGADIFLQRCYPWEMNVVNAQAMYGDLHEIHHKPFVPRMALLAQYAGNKKLQDKIAAVPSASIMYGKTMPRDTDMIAICESYRLPVYDEIIVKGKRQKKLLVPGRKTICIENATLYDGEWLQERFPFVYFPGDDPVIGFWGQSEAEKLIGKQLSLNRMNRIEEEAFETCSAPMVLNEESANVNISHLQNMPGTIINYRITPPQIYTPNPVSPQLGQRIERVTGYAYSEVGLSQYSASARNPLGANASGKALREYKDNESLRFSPRYSCWDNACIDTVQAIRDQYKQLYDEIGDFEVTYHDGESIGKIMFSDLEDESEEYLIDVFPTNFFSQTPSAKFQEVDELVNKGWLDRPDGMRLMDIPDLKSVTSLYTAELDYMDALISRFLDLGIPDEEVYVAPEPYAPLETGIKMMKAAYQRATVDGLPADRLDLFRQWIEGAYVLLNSPPPGAPSNQPQPPAGAAPGVPPGAPPAEPMPSPEMAMPQ